MEGEPFGEVEARQLIRFIADNGDVLMSRHARERMEERGLTRGDLDRVLCGGWVDLVEEQNGSWRYRVTTHTDAFVVAFVSREELIVVSGWRLS